MLTPDCKNLFSFSVPEITYLDHGGFGVSPREVRDYAESVRRKIEEAPRQYLDEEDRPIWRKSANLVAKRFGANAGDVALTENVTEAANAILQSFPFEPGDEIVLNSMTYGAVLNTAKFVAKRVGAKIKEIPFQYPAPDPDRYLEQLKESISPKTKLVLLDHIAAATALVMPIKDMVKICHDKGVPCMVDGAHVPGHLALDIPSIGADWYIASLSKWYFAPRACGFLWASKDRQRWKLKNGETQNLMPAIFGWESFNPFPENFIWTGTRDRAAIASIPTAFNFMDRFGEEHVRTHNHKLIRAGIRMLNEAWNCKFQTPDSMTGAIALLPLPENLAALSEHRYVVQNAIFNEFKVSCPIIPVEGKLYVRVAANIYNEDTDFEKLANAVSTISRRGVPALGL